jgi:hypothetical protein
MLIYDTGSDIFCYTYAMSEREMHTVVMWQCLIFEIESSKKCAILDLSVDISDSDVKNFQTTAFTNAVPDNIPNPLEL